MNGNKFEDTSLFTSTKHTHKKYPNKSYDHSSNINNSHKYIEDINDECLISLQYAINKQAVIDLKEKYNIESVKHLCDYLLSHIIEDENTMKEVIYKALEERQMKSLKQLAKSIKESEDIINDMKLSLEEMYNLMCEDEAPKIKKAPAASEKAEEIEEKLKESTTIEEDHVSRETSNEEENSEEESEEN